MLYIHMWLGTKEPTLQHQKSHARILMIQKSEHAEKNSAKLKRFSVEKGTA